MRIAFPRRVLIGWLVLSALTLALSPPTVRAERLSIKNYTTADGLARDQVNRIVTDSRGFVWFCTVEGLSRFDGYRFVNYTTHHGLPHRNVTDLLETRAGDYWVATVDGICRFNPSGYAPGSGPKDKDGAGAGPVEPMFAAYRPDEENGRWSYDLFEDSAGNVWCGTEGGLYRLDLVDGQLKLTHVEVGLPKVTPGVGYVYTIVEDRYQTLWISSNSGLCRRWPDGRFKRYTTTDGLPENPSSLLIDRTGKLWAGTRNKGLYHVTFDSERMAVSHTVDRSKDLPGDSVGTILESSRGSVLVGTDQGLAEFDQSGAAGQKPRIYTTAQGLSANLIGASAEDREGNLWLACRQSGVIKLARYGLTAYGKADGLGEGDIYSIFETNFGEMCLLSGGLSDKRFLVFDGRRFKAVRPNLTRQVANFGWGTHQNSFQDYTGQWWFTTAEGLYRYPNVSVEQLARVRPKAIYGKGNGLLADETYRLYEDSRGDVWVSSFGYPKASLCRWERATETFHHYGEPEIDRSWTPTAFREDGSGNLWIGMFAWSGSYPNALYRYANGGFTAFTASDGLPPGHIWKIYLDRAGRLWLGISRSGLVRVDDPSAERPQFVSYTTAQGLASDDVSDIVEDDFGRLYLVTGRGLNRFDPDTGHVKHYTTADGLGGGYSLVAVSDRQGALWFAGQEVSRLVPEPETELAPPPVFISGLRVEGSAHKISELGQSEVSLPELEPYQNQIQIDFFSIGLAAGETLRYQYRLEGADENWCPPTDQRSLNLSLSPGTYRFLVRAVRADGTTSLAPAAVSLTILRPVWQRWWFVALAALLLASLIYAAYRYRVARLIELERVRMRIATDLHDDIGASLSRMAILSEVVKQQTANGHNQSSRMLTEIAESARGLVDSMSDIVWSIDPRKDDLSNVAMRVRQFASDVLESQGIDWKLEVPPEAERVKLPPEQRRHVYLIFKEAINNIARHAACDTVTLKIAPAHDSLRIDIRDNGRGFDLNSLEASLANNRGGNGLKNMQARAAEAGGSLEIISSPGSGTELIANLPLRGSHARKNKGVGA